MSKIQNLKVGCEDPPKKQVGGLGPCGPPGSATCGLVAALAWEVI